MISHKLPSLYYHSLIHLLFVCLLNIHLFIYLYTNQSSDRTIGAMIIAQFVFDYINVIYPVLFVVDKSRTYYDI